MCWLINTKKDVEILCDAGIIINYLENEESVAALFNHMGRELPLSIDDCYLTEVCEEIDQYNKSRWPRLRAALVRDYFKNPWQSCRFSLHFFYCWLP